MNKIDIKTKTQKMLKAKELNFLNSNNFHLLPSGINY